MSCSRKAYVCWCKRSVAGNLVWAGLYLSTAVHLPGQSGITNEGPFTVFRTGGDEPLLTLSLPVGPASSNSPSFLQFDFGFGTAETNAPSTFFDSFSVTLQRNDLAETALLLTADQTGVRWAPPNPGGLTVDPADLQSTGATFPNLEPPMPLRFAFSVTFAIPMALTGGPLTLFFDFFDNLNSLASLAWVQNVRLRTTAALKLYSAPGFEGPFTEETTALLNETSRTFTLNKGTGRRYFRIGGDRPTKIDRIRLLGDQVVLDYHLVQVALESAASFAGPFTEQTAAVSNSTNRTFSVSAPTGSRFYRVNSDVPTRLKAPRLNGNQHVLEYEFVP